MDVDLSPLPYCSNFVLTSLLFVQRIQLYNAYATSAMCDAGYDVIDVYPLAASWPLGTKAGDVVHYSPEVFASVEQMLGKLKLGPDLSHGNNERRTMIKKCIVR